MTRFVGVCTTCEFARRARTPGRVACLYWTLARRQAPWDPLPAAAALSAMSGVGFPRQRPRLEGSRKCADPTAVPDMVVVERDDTCHFFRSRSQTSLNLTLTATFLRTGPAARTLTRALEEAVHPRSFRRTVARPSEQPVAAPRVLAPIPPLVPGATVRPQVGVPSSAPPLGSPARGPMPSSILAPQKGPCP